MIEAQKKIYDEYQEDSLGLSQWEASERLKIYGTNELSAQKKVSPLALFFGQFQDFMTVILMAAIGASWILGETADGITILIIILMNGVLGFIQEYRTEKSLEALKELSAPVARVIRDGREQSIPAKEVVPGDLLILEAGDKITADCVLVEATNLQVNESILTGESTPVEKRVGKRGTQGEEDREHLLFMGTTITMGRAKARVVSTGMTTEMGKIAHMLQSVEEEDTPLKRRLNRIGKELVFICLAVCLLIMIAGIYHGETIYSMLLSGISLAVAAIPEGLPAIVTVSLAIGVQRMLKRQALVRKLPAVETLGSVNVICSDKTGTLTENKMTVKKIFVEDQTLEVSGQGHSLSGEFSLDGRTITPREHQTLKMLLAIGALCNNAEINGEEVYGDPTEVAILVASAKGNLVKGAGVGYKRLAEIPFDSDRKLMSVICSNEKNELFLMVKGAPDKIFERCTQRLGKGGIQPFDGLEKGRAARINEEMASQALRVLAFAYKPLTHMPRELSAKALEKDLIFVGLEGMIDPPRPEAIQAIKSCYGAGIKPVMITGDHKSTALAVGKELGMHIANHRVVTGDEIEKMGDQELENVVRNTVIFARVTPRHKLRIVQAFKRRGNIVAMTGDGVNDAPALKEADIGVAMGKTGTDVAKEASAMVLLDDNFATIVAAVEEGRMIYDNIRKFIRYLLSCNLGEILMMGVAAFIGMPMPLIPIQILWLNLVTDGLPALALGVDPPDEEIMRRPPRKQNEGIFSKGLGGNIFISGALIGISSLLAFAIVMYQNGDLNLARTTAFTTMIVAELLYAFECRSERVSVFKVGMGKNPYLLAATLSSFALTFLVLYEPHLSQIFKTVALGLKEWALVVGLSAVEFIINSLIPFQGE